MSASCVSHLPPTPPDLQSLGPWAAVYGPMRDEEVAGLDLLIVDPAEFPEPQKARDLGVRWVVAYLSVGELNENTEDYQRYSGRSWLVEENASWPSWLVDVRDEEWREHVLEQARELIEAGYDGWMLDTVSVASMLEAREPERFAGSVEAMQSLARSLRREHPAALIIPNGGLSVVGPIASEFNAIVVEAAYGGFDAARGEYGPHRSLRDRWNLLRSLMRICASHDMPALAIDYFALDDEEGARLAASAYESLGIRYYFGPADLREHHARR